MDIFSHCSKWKRYLTLCWKAVLAQWFVMLLWKVLFFQLLVTPPSWYLASSFRDAVTVCDHDAFVAEALDLPNFQARVKECKESLPAVPGKDPQLILSLCNGKQKVLVSQCFKAQVKLWMCRSSCCPRGAMRSSRSCANFRLSSNWV